MNLTSVTFTPLTRVSVPGGDVLHGLKVSDSTFFGYGEAYFSLVDMGHIKAWKLHKTAILNLIVPVGRVKFVFCILTDSGINEYREEIIGSERYGRLTIPPGIWFGFEGLEYPHSLIMSISNILHDSGEVDRKSLGSLRYDWSK